MKILRYLMMAILIVGMSGVAHAAGFSWNLQDPDTPGFFSVTPGVPFTFQFADCGFDIGGITYTGCALGQNSSATETLTSFQFTIPTTLGAPDCVSNEFAVVSCGLSSDGSEYVLAFECDPSNPTCGIAPKGIFSVFENAVDGSAFPEVAGVANATTPEPSSILLALSGMGSLGYLVRRRRGASSR